VGVIALSGAMASLLMMGSVLGVKPAPLSMIVVGALGLFSILSFVRLGIQSFSLLKPSNVVRSLFTEILDNVTAATPQGRRWQHPLFQDLYRRRTERSLQLIDAVVQMAGTSRHVDREGTASLAVACITMIQQYALARLAIPTSSLWFPRVPRHQDWLLASPSEISTFAVTGLPLQPKAVSDPAWFEKEIEIIADQALRILL
jgi:hypothetical protein